MVKFNVYYTTIDFILEIKELYREWTGKEYNSNYTLWNSHFIVARTETNQIVGVAQLIIIQDPFFNRNWGLVENVYVKKGYRRIGVARGLMEHITNQAEQFGCIFIKLTSGKKGGRALYRALGYEEGSSFRKDLHPEDIGKKEGQAFIALKRRIGENEIL